MGAEIQSGLVWSSVHEGWDDERTTSRPDLRVGIVLWPDFTLTALSGFVDALRLAADVGDRSKQVRCRWTVMSIDGLPVRASCGLEVTPNGSLAGHTEFDYLVVASGLIGGIEKASPRLDEYLRAADEAGVCLVGLCTGGIVLARAGLMTGRRCCIASFHVGDLEGFETGAVPLFDRLFLDDGDRITCAGGVASIDLASYLVERHCGGERAIKLVDRLLADRPRAGTHAQNRSWLDLHKVKDRRVRRALVLMEQNLQSPLTIRELADRLHTSERHVERIFGAAFGKSPSKVYRSLRLRFGHWMLANTTQTVTQIAFECGFSDSSHFCRQFLDEFGTTPTTARVRGGLGTIAGAGLVPGSSLEDPEALGDREASGSRSTPESLILAG